MYEYGTEYGTGLDYGYASGTGFDVSGLIALMGTYFLFMLIVSIVMIISLYKIYKKAGKKGWEAIVPIYNIIVLLEITKLPMWYLILLIVPFANIYVIFKMYIELAHKFGKSTGFGILTIFFSVICLPILAFGKDTYIDNNQNTNNNYSEATSSPNQYVAQSQQFAAQPQMQQTQATSLGQTQVMTPTVEPINEVPVTETLIEPQPMQNQETVINNEIPMSEQPFVEEVQQVLETPINNPTTENNNDTTELL